MILKILTIAIVLCAFFYNKIRIKNPNIFLNSDPKPPSRTPRLSAEEIKFYHENGYLFKKAFISNIDDLVYAGRQTLGLWEPLDILFKKAYNKLTFQRWRQSQSFATLAFESSLPTISAQLLFDNQLQIDNNAKEKGLRIMRDAFFAQTRKSGGCGWHVDDLVFWPADSNGVTAWIALSHYKIVDGGGIRVSAGSHLNITEYNHCRQVILTNTCAMHELSKSCDELLNSHSVAFDMEPGDVILWDRYLFHKSEAIRTEDDKQENNDIENSKMRYTIRYIPNGAKRRKGSVMVHDSVEEEQEFSGSYYPQVWPTTIENEIKEIREGLTGDFPMTFSNIYQIITRAYKSRKKQ